MHGFYYCSFDSMICHVLRYFPSIKPIHHVKGREGIPRVNSSMLESSGLLERNSSQAITFQYPIINFDVLKVFP